MKATLTLLAPVILLSSCTTSQNPFGIPAPPAANVNNPFGVPGTPNVPTAPPYQPIDPINPPATPNFSNTPSFTPPPAPASPSGLNGNVHTIRKGDSLWGLSRKYNTSVDAIKTLNGIESNTIIEGRTLIIPGR